MFDVGLNRAVTVLAEKKANPRGRSEATALKDLGAHPVSGKPVKVLSGRYGPYIKHEATNANLPKGTDPQDLTMDQAVALLAARVEKGGGKKPARPARNGSGAKAAPKKPAAKKAAAPKKVAAKKPAAKRACAS